MYKRQTLGSASFTIVAPVKDYGNDLNNWSVGIRLTYGSNSFLMCGDAESQAESDMLERGMPLKADVLKAGHHGSSTSTSSVFLKAVSPSYVVILVYSTTPTRRTSLFFSLFAVHPVRHNNMHPIRILLI